MTALSPEAVEAVARAMRVSDLARVGDASPLAYYERLAGAAVTAATAEIQNMILQALWPIDGVNQENVVDLMEAMLVASSRFAKAEVLREAAEEMNAKYVSIDYGHWRGREYCEGQEMAYDDACDWLHARAAAITNEDSE